MKLKCQCCEYEEEFGDEEEAFEAGWDCLPYFSTHVCCPLCPAVCIVMGHSHNKAHANWDQHGRPLVFNQQCLIDQNWNDDFDQIIDKAKKLINPLIEAQNNGV